MPNPLQHLENNEAVLLMYAANELPPEDRAEVEQMLAVDSGMRAELESIRLSLSIVDSAMGELDAITRLPMSSPVALRRLLPALSAWQQSNTSPPAPTVMPHTLRYPWWVYPTASAAAILLAAIIWWGAHGDEHDAASIGSANNTFAQGDVGSGGGAGEIRPGRFGALMLMDPTFDPGLVDAEQQVAALDRRGDENAAMSSIFMTDTAGTSGTTD